MDSQPRQQMPSRFWFPIWNQTPTPTQPNSPSSLVLESLKSRPARTSRYALQSHQEASVPTISSPPTPSQGAACFSSNKAAQIEAKIGDSSGKDETEEQGSNQNEKLSVEQPHHAESQHAQNIINLAGENNGASMLIGHETSKNADHLETVHEIDKQSKTIHDEDETHRERSQVNNEVLSSTSINSNVQNINNSIIHDSSCRHLEFA